jgi:hypothetical protein
VRNDEELAALQTELRAWEEETFAELEKCAATKSDVSWVRPPGRSGCGVLRRLQQRARPGRRGVTLPARDLSRTIARRARRLNAAKLPVPPNARSGAA